SHRSGDSTRGIRSCTAARSPTAAVVTMEQVSTGSSGGPQTDHRPPKTTGPPSSGVMKYACLRCLRPSVAAAGANSYHPVAGTRQRRLANGEAKARVVATVSARALIIRAAARRSFAHGGSRPHRATDSTRPPAVADIRTTGTGSVGATL